VPSLDVDACRARFAAARRAVLATHGPAARLALVPVTFALVGDTLVSAVDHKPKRTRALQRLADIEAEPAVSLLVDHYHEDWDSLWWVRLEGRATVVDGRAGRLLAGDAAVAAATLVERYPSYRATPPAGPWIVVRAERWVGWTALPPEVPASEVPDSPR
jgi:PPOX class probable F420-dependent enzyme